MAEPQIPGTLQGVPSEGNPSPVQSSAAPGYMQPTDERWPLYQVVGAPVPVDVAPVQRDYRQVCEWRW